MLRAEQSSHHAQGTAGREKASSKGAKPLSERTSVAGIFTGTLLFKGFKASLERGCSLYDQLKWGAWMGKKHTTCDKDWNTGADHGDRTQESYLFPRSL